MNQLRTCLLIAFVVLVLAGSSAEGQDQAARMAAGTVSAQAPEVQSHLAKAPEVQSYLAKAAQFYRTGKLDEAAREYNGLIQAEPASALAYAGLVRVYLKQKKPAEAYTAAGKAIELAPTLDGSRVAMGEVYFRQGKMADAETQFATLVRQGTKEARAYLGLSRIYEAASYHEHAKMMIDRAYALDPADPDIRKAWIRTLSLRDRLKALEAYLSGDTSDDDEEHRRLEEHLAILKHESDEATPPCHLATKLTSMETPLERLQDTRILRGFGLRVKLNEVSSKLLLDTGAGGIVVNRKVAEKAGIKPLIQTEIKGIGDKGGAGGYIGYADSIKIGDLEFRDCYVKVIDKRSVVDEDGLIGANVFSQFLVDIDFPRSKLRLSQLPTRPEGPTAAAQQQHDPGASRFHDPYVAPEMKSFTPVYQFGHDLLIPTTVNDLPPKLFLIDTGAFSNMISPAAAREVTKVSSDSTLL